MEKRINQPRTARETVVSSRRLLQYNLLAITRELVQEVLNNHQATLVSMKQELAIMGNCRLKIRHKDEKTYFSSKDMNTGKETSILGETAKIHMLARRQVIEKTVKAVSCQMRMLQRVLNDTEEAYYETQMEKGINKYIDAGMDLSRILFTKEQNEWVDETFSPNPYKPENLKYQTGNKVWVRSKSEKTIGNELEKIGLPYRYEDIVRLQGSDYENRPFHETYYADFKVPNLLGGITVHEHFGAFQIDNYAKNALSKLNDYHNFTVVEIPGRQVKRDEFTWSFESDLRDEKSKTALIKKILLPSY